MSLMETRKYIEMHFVFWMDDGCKEDSPVFQYIHFHSQQYFTCSWFFQKEWTSSEQDEYNLECSFIQRKIWRESIIHSCSVFLLWLSKILYLTSFYPILEMRFKKGLLQWIMEGNSYQGNPIWIKFSASDFIDYSIGIIRGPCLSRQSEKKFLIPIYYC